MNILRIRVMSGAAVIISTTMFAANIPNPAPVITTEAITNSPSYHQYVNPRGDSASSWSDIANALYFYKKSEPDYEFTNFYRAPVTLDGVIWPTNEHYYQAMKFTDANLQEKIRTTYRARDVFTIGQDNKSQVRSDWKEVNLAIMAKVVLEKFRQHPDLAAQLVATGTRVLVENAKDNDSFFGAGGNYRGNNYLGRILMLVRNLLSIQKNNLNKEKL